MNFSKKLSRYGALLKYHRPSQFGWRLVRIMQRHLRARLPNVLRFSEANSTARWKPGAREAYRQISHHRLNLWPGRSQQAGKISEGHFTFLSESRSLGIATDDGQLSIDWNPEAPRLWRFHLQCQENLLECANQRGDSSAFDVIRSWLGETRHLSPTGDPDAWHPFCISRRLPVWLALAATYELPNDLAEAFWESVGAQTKWLSKNCEWDLGGNHLIENLTALLLANSFLDIEPSRNLSWVAARLERELKNQTLPSGEHFERAPTYHALMLVSVLHCVEAADFAKSASKDAYVLIAERMWALAEWIRQPHGMFPLLGDSVKKETPDLDRLHSWVDRHGDTENARSSDDSVIGTKPLDQTNTSISTDYWAIESHDKHRILFDVGPLACDHLPAHGHADLLQVVASIHGHDAIVDSGNYQYEAGDLRLKCRQTKAHNVLQVGNEQQCDLWSSFRMGRRGHPVWTKRGKSGVLNWCAAAHDGFGFRVGRVVIACPNSWTILDWFAGKTSKGRVTSRLHWHPAWHLVTTNRPNELSAVLRQESHTEHRCTVRGLGHKTTLSSHSTEYYPDFGHRLDNACSECSGEYLEQGWLGFELTFEFGKESMTPEVIQSSGRLSATFPDHEPLVWEL